MKKFLKFNTFKEAFFSTSDFKVRQELIDFLTAEKKRLKHPDSRFWIEELWQRMKCQVTVTDKNEHACL
jgi:hypothetical protein